MKKFWKRTFVDDFRGKPDFSPESTFCYDQLKPQCHIWRGAQTHDCDTPYDPNRKPPDPGIIPPLRENWVAVLNVMDPGQAWTQQSFQSVRSAYSQLVSQNLSALNKCTWTMYDMLDIWATDYRDNYSSRMDPSQVKVHPEGKGYLELLSVYAPVAADCVYGGSPSGPNKINCGLYSFSSNQVVPGVHYWVDANPNWPGVYYAQIGGQCLFGGGKAGPNCQVVAFPQGFVESGIGYWVDTDPRWPGVYYANSTPYRCKDNVVYLSNSGGLLFKDLTCPVLTGALMSMNNPLPWPSTWPRGFTQQYGRFEAKLRIPKGTGSFPAAWMMPIQGDWPYTGEIDLMEARDAANEIYQTYHNGKCFNASFSGEATNFLDATGKSLCGTSGPPNLTGYHPTRLSVGKTVPERLASEFWTRDHVFAVEWSPDSLRFYINNVRTNYIGPGTLSTLETSQAVPPNLSRLDPQNFPTFPFFWILDNATYVPQSGLATFQKQSYWIDYVSNYAPCQTQADFCPCGGTFTEGVGCSLGVGETLNCPLGTPPVTLSGQVYASECKQVSEDCVNGGVTAGPNCSIYSFQNPEVIPSISYWVDTNPLWPGVYYAQIGGQCPYGGSKGGPNCHLVGFPAGVLSTAVHYWVDTNPRWPGVYYAQIGGQCPYGGSKGGPNCQLRTFALPSLYVVAGVHYWVDSDPRWPGVYYQQVAGQCPYRGAVSGPNCQLLAFPNDVLETGVSYWVDTDPRWPGVYYSPDFRQ